MTAVSKIIESTQYPLSRIVIDIKMAVNTGIALITPFLKGITNEYDS